MRRAFLLSAMLAIVLSAGVLAVERATFILTNGDRVSGLVVSHTAERTNIRSDRNEFNVDVDGGPERTIPFDRVAVIDFVGNAPNNDELSKLPDNGHALMMRDGGVREGRLIDLIGGDHVRFEYTSGRREDVPIVDVRRAYLNVGSARSVFNYQKPAAQVASSGSSGSNASAGNRGVIAANRANISGTSTVDVRGANAWTDSGLSVRLGDSLLFETAGEVFYIRGDIPGVGAAGTGSPAGRGYPVPTAPVGALIGRIGGGAPFAIGASTSPILMLTNGRLMLGINDDNFGDNSGLFSVTIGRLRR